MGAANDADERSRSGLSPAVISNWAPMTGPMQWAVLDEPGDGAPVAGNGGGELVVVEMVTEVVDDGDVDGVFVRVDTADVRSFGCHDGDTLLLATDGQRRPARSDRTSTRPSQRVRLVLGHARPVGAANDAGSWIDQSIGSPAARQSDFGSRPPRRNTSMATLPNLAISLHRLAGAANIAAALRATARTVKRATNLILTS